MMRLAFALPLLALASPLAAQDHDHSAPETVEPAADSPAMDHSAMGHDEMDHSTMDHSQMNHEAMDHSAMGHDMPMMQPEAPARATQGPAHAADAIWGADAMQAAREQLVEETGGAWQGSSLMVERLEARIGEREAYLWDLQGFIGGDLDRFVLKSEGEGEFGGSVESAEVQALWGHAIGPFVDLQAGVRLDLEPETRSHAVVGIQGLAPYMLHYDVAAFLSDRGDLTARIEAEYDQKLTQRLILQPRVEMDLAAQDIPERDIGAGLSSFEAGLRLRYEFVREFAPYVGIDWEQKLGETRDIARAKGEDPGKLLFLAGIRAWF